MAVEEMLLGDHGEAIQVAMRREGISRVLQFGHL